MNFANAMISESWLLFEHLVGATKTQSAEHKRKSAKPNGERQAGEAKAQSINLKPMTVLILSPTTSETLEFDESAFDSETALVPELHLHRLIGTSVRVSMLSVPSIESHLSLNNNLCAATKLPRPARVRCGATSSDVIDEFRIASSSDE